MRDTKDDNAQRTSGRQLQQFLTFRLARLQARLNVQASRVLSEHAGLTLMQWRVLALAGSMGPHSSSALARAAAIDKGLFSRNLKSLIDAGLAQTKADKTDQRQQVVTLTAKGRALHEHTLPVMQARQAFLLDQLSRREQDVVFSILEKLDTAAAAIEFHT